MILPRNKYKKQKERKRVMKRNMMEWVDNVLAAKQKQGFLVLSFPAIQKMGITVKDLIASSDLQAQAMKIVADATPEAAASVRYLR